jgi:hypothetical protein
MGRGRSARTVFDENALDALARNVRELVLIDYGHLGGGGVPPVRR